MSGFVAFVISFGGMLALIALMAAWLSRLSPVPVWQIITVMTLAIVAACAAPLQVGAMLGYPKYTAYASLPKQAELVAFVPHDEDMIVDLWLRQGSNPPRAYETTLDDAMKSMLREAGARLGQGERVGVRKGPKRQGVADIETPEAPYVLDNSAFALPSKGGGE